MLRVAIIGPESTGKSTLAQQLAEKYHGIYVPEYAREYVEQLQGRPYTYDDVCAIARHQIEQLKAYAAPTEKCEEREKYGQYEECAQCAQCGDDASRVVKAYADNAKYANNEKYANNGTPGASIVFFDTELIITRVWFDYCYGSTPDWVLSAMRQYKPDIYLLMYPDIAWVDDPVRENGGEAVRLELFRRYEQEIQALDVPYYIIRHTPGGGISATPMSPSLKK